MKFIESLVNKVDVFVDVSIKEIEELDKNRKN